LLLLTKLFVTLLQVDYACLPEEVQQHFQDCGTVNRVTILTDNFGHPKGFAYVEFLDIEAVQNALQLNDTELHGRRLKVKKFISLMICNHCYFEIFSI
jgi:RNA recognition motif-containing protein